VQLSSQALSARHRIAALRNKLDDELGSKLRKALRGWVGGGGRRLTKTTRRQPPARKQGRKVCETSLA